MRRDREYKYILGTVKSAKLGTTDNSETKSVISLYQRSINNSRCSSSQKQYTYKTYIHLTASVK